MCQKCDATAKQQQQNLSRMLVFAKQHDWGHNAHILHGVLYVEEHSVHTPTGRVRKVFVPVRNMRELLDWAGY